MSLKSSEGLDVQLNKGRDEMRKLKGILVAAGVLLILTGLSLQSIPDEQTTTLWEELPDEEVQAYIQKEEQTEDLAVDEPVAKIQYAEVRQPSEGLPQATGKVNEFTLEEARLLMKIAQAEAGNQGSDGMWLVMSVVLNRVKSPDYPDTLKEVIYQPYQFSSVNDGNFDGQETLSTDTHEALARIEAGDVAEEIIAFETINNRELDKYFCEAFTFRNHRFYTSK